MGSITLIQLLFDGVTVFVKSAVFFLAVTLVIIGNGSILTWISSRISGARESVSLLAIYSSGTASLVLVSLGFVLTKTINSRLPVVMFVTCFVLGFVQTIRWVRKFPRLNFEWRSEILITILLVVVILFLRLAFLDDLEFPLFHDSAIHYQIVLDLLRTSDPSSQYEPVTELLVDRYYHVGYHSSVAFFYVVLKQVITLSKIILLLGQYFLFVLILGVGYVAKSITNSSLAFRGAVLFAGLGWSMPGYAVNWGKYPALLSLVFICFSLIWFVEAFSKQNEYRSNELIIAGICLLVGVLVHTRSLILWGCIAVAVILYYYTKRPSPRVLSIFWITSVVLFAVTAVFLDPLSEALLAYAKNNYLFVSLLASVLAVLGSQKMPRENFTIFSFIFTLGSLASFKTPFFFTRFAGEYILDRPMMQLVLFAPFSILASSGVVVLLRDKSLISKKLRNQRVVINSLIVLMGLVFISIQPITEFYPQDCCIYMHNHDRVAIQWLSENVTDGYRVAVARRQETDRYVPTDAGVWITPLTGIKTSRTDIDIDLTDFQVMSDLCQNDNQFIYVSLVDESFSVEDIQSKPDFYIPEILLSGVQVYSLNCSSNFPPP